jgi:hypothetical protein
MAALVPPVRPARQPAHPLQVLAAANLAFWALRLPKRRVLAGLGRSQRAARP